MSHILVKWVEDEKWDVYPVNALADADVAFRLISQQGCIKQLRGSVHRVSWKEGAPPALAVLLAFGNPQQLEKKRARLVLEAGVQSHDLPTENINPCSTCAVQVKQLLQENEALRGEVESMKRTAEERDHVAEAAKLVKRLRKALGKAETHTEKTAEALLACPKVDIGGGVSVEKGTLEKLSRACVSGPGKFARALLRIVFTQDELRGKTLLGGKSNLHLSQPLKEALDPVRVQAVIDYTCSKFPTASISYIKNSLSSMLARELKEPSEINC